MMEYTKIHTSIDTEWMHTYIPECWAALVPLKAEFYKGKSCSIVVVVLTLRLICMPDFHIKDLREGVCSMSNS